MVFSHQYDPSNGILCLFSFTYILRQLNIYSFFNTYHKVLKILFLLQCMQIFYVFSYRSADPIGAGHLIGIGLLLPALS